MRAALRGVIDFTQARLLDVNLWRRCTILLNAVAKEDDGTLFGRIYDYHRALVANSGLTEDSFKQAQHNAKDAFNDLLGVLRPWEGKGTQDRKAKEVEALRQRYINHFGFDPSDPAWQAKNEADLAAWKARREQQAAAREAVENDAERVRRLSLERDMRIAQLRREQENQRFRQGR